MATPPRLAPLLAQFDFARERLADRLVGPDVDSGNGVRIPIVGLTDEEYRREPVPGCWSIRPRAAGPGPGATTPPPAPEPPPFTTLAWRLGHLSESIARRAEYTIGAHSLTRADYRHSGTAAGWRAALTSADDATLDMVGRGSFPDGSDPDEPFIDIVWWVNQALLHHSAEIALLRDLYRARRG